MKTSDKIISYIEKQGRATGKEIADYIDDITPRAVRKQLRALFDRGVLEKTGRPPKVFYALKESPETKTVQKKMTYVVIVDIVKKTIEERYLYITPDGNMKRGWEGFVLWCTKTQQDPVKTAKKYIATLRKYDVYSKNGLIDATQKMRETFPETYIDILHYIDFYSIERFGKTRIGQILLHAKNSQDRKMIRTLAEEVRPRVLDIVTQHAVDGVLFIPPTIKREIQLIKELEKHLRLPAKTLSVAKVKTQVTVAQKTLSKLEERIENARKTIVVEDRGIFENILLIDDAVGSGATLQEVAAQIRKKGLCKGKIIGLAIVGSFKGFDVISEV